MTPEQREELKQAALAAKGWDWNAVQGDQFGRQEDGSFYDIGTVDADQYSQGGDGEDDYNGTVLRFIAKAKPAAILSLIAQVEAQAAEREKLLKIIASAYQIAGAHDASELVLDVLSAPLAATDAQIEALLPYQVEALTVPHWISVLENLPEHGQPVLISDGVTMATASLEYCEGKPRWWNGYGFDGYEWDFDFGSGKVETTTCTHWMPVPAAPTIPAIPGTKEGA